LQGENIKLQQQNINREIRKIAEERGQKNEKIKNLQESLPAKINQYETWSNKYQKEFSFINPENIQEEIIYDTVSKAKERVNETIVTYETKYKNILENTEFKIDDERLKGNHKFDFQTLAVVMLTEQVIKNTDKIENELDKDIETYLNSISEKMKEINEHKLSLIETIFKNVETAYENFEDEILDLKDFFKDNKVAGDFFLTIEFEPSKEYPISWIASLKKRMKNKLLNQGLFKALDKENKSVDEVLQETFLEFSEKKVPPDARKLLNPKSYFNLKIDLKSPNGESASQTGGTGYAILALLCIARLSLIDNSHKAKVPKKGIRFMAIDEVAGLGENFGMLYEIAKKYDYQMLTMTISDNNYLYSDQQYAYTLLRNTVPEFYNVNPVPMLQISQTDYIVHLGDFIEFFNKTHNG